jgi:tetrahydromethanopterin S-methyltransferase subunit E
MGCIKHLLFTSSFCAIFLLDIYHKIIADLLSGQIQQNKLFVPLLILIFIILIGFVTEIWVQSFYGKYAKSESIGRIKE